MQNEEKFILDDINIFQPIHSSDVYFSKEKVLTNGWNVINTIKIKKLKFPHYIGYINDLLQVIKILF